MIVSKWLSEGFRLKRRKVMLRSGKFPVNVHVGLDVNDRIPRRTCNEKE